MTKEIIDQRKNDLNSYLCGIANSPTLYKTESVLQLIDPQNILGEGSF